MALARRPLRASMRHLLVLALRTALLVLPVLRLALTALVVLPQEPSLPGQAPPFSLPHRSLAYGCEFGVSRGSAQCSYCRAERQQNYLRSFVDTRTVWSLDLPWLQLTNILLLSGTGAPPSDYAAELAREPRARRPPVPAQVQHRGE